MNRTQAIWFVKQNGNEIEQARLRYLLHGERPSPIIIQQLFNGQREDGGFAPFWAPNYSSIDATCYRLAQAEQLGLGATKLAVANAVRFLLLRQGENGRFSEDPSVANSAPPWAAPGDLAAELYLTANAGFWLAFFGYVEAAEQSANFLTSHLDADRHKLPSFAQAQWLACGLAWQLGVLEMVDHLSSYLYANLPHTASELAWMLGTLQGVNLSRGPSVIMVGALRLAQRQEADGRFPSDEGQDVHTTLEALRVFAKWDADHPDLPDFFDQ